MRRVAFSAVWLTCCVATAAAAKIDGTAQEAPQNSCARRSAVCAYSGRSTQVLRPPPLMDLRISAPPSTIPRFAPPQLSNRRAPPAITQQLSSAQPHLDAVCKKPCTAVRILKAVKDTPPSPPFPRSPPRATRSMNAHVGDHNSRVAATSSIQFIGASAASAASRAFYYYAVSLRSHDENNRSCYALLLRPAVYNMQLGLRGRAMNPVACTMGCAQEFEGAQAERTRVACTSKEPFPGTACTDCTRSSTPAQTHALASASLQHTEHQSASATHSLTPTVLPDWEHLHPRPVAQSYIAIAHAPSGVRSCALHNLRALYIEFSPRFTIDYSSHLSICNLQSRVAASVSEPVGAQLPSSLVRLRPGTSTLPTYSAVKVSVSAASSSTAVMLAHTRPKPHHPRSFKRRAGSVSSPGVAAQKQPALRSPVRGYPVTRSSAKAAAAAAVTAPSRLPMPSSAPTHADLQQFALVHSRDSSLSLQIVEVPESSENLAAVRCESEVPSRLQTPPLSAAAPSTVATIVIDETPTPPLRSRRSALLDDDEYNRVEREIMQVTRNSAVDAPAAVAANPLATSALSTRALSACASTTSAPTTSAPPTTACAFAFAVADTFGLFAVVIRHCFAALAKPAAVWFIRDTACAVGASTSFVCAEGPSGDY